MNMNLLVTIALIVVVASHVTAQEEFVRKNPERKPSKVASNCQLSEGDACGGSNCCSRSPVRLYCYRAECMTRSRVAEVYRAARRTKAKPRRRTKPVQRPIAQRPNVQRPVVSMSPFHEDTVEIASCRLGLGGICRGRAKTMSSFCGCGTGLRCEASRKAGDVVEGRHGRSRPVFRCAHDVASGVAREDVQTETEYTYERPEENVHNVQRPIAFRLRPPPPRRMSNSGRLVSEMTEIESCTLGENDECNGHRGKTMATFCSGCGTGLECKKVKGEMRPGGPGSACISGDRGDHCQEAMMRCRPDGSGVPPQQGRENVFVTGDGGPIAQRPMGFAGPVHAPHHVHDNGNDDEDDEETEGADDDKDQD